MARNQRKIDAPQDAVFEALLDPNVYVEWVVGAKRVRWVDDEWPARGASFGHQLAGTGGVLRDKTTLVDLDEPRSLSLEAYARPFGKADVTISVTPTEGSSFVVVNESISKSSRLRKLKTLFDPMIYLRNVEGLRRLDRIVRQRHNQAET